MGVSILVIVTGGLQSVLIARRFGPAGKGLIALVLLVPGTLTPLLGAGFAASCVYFASRAPASDTVKNATTFAVLASVVGASVALLLAVTGALDHIAPELSNRYLLIALGMLPVVLAQGLFGGLLMGLGEIPRVNAIRAFNALGSLGVVGFSVGTNRGPFLIVCGIAVVTALAVGLQIRALHALGAPIRLGWSKKVGRAQLVFAAKDHPGTVVQFMNYRLDQLFVSGYRGASGLGLYTVAVTVGEMLWLVPDAIATVVFPRASRERSGEGRHATVVAATTSLILAGIGAVGLFFVGRPLIVALFSEEFGRSYEALRWILPGAVVLGPAKILAADLAGRGYPIINSACASIGLVMTIGFDLVLIPAHGIVGAAIASSISYLAVAGTVALAFVLLPAQAESSRSEVIGNRVGRND